MHRTEPDPGAKQLLLEWDRAEIAGLIQLDANHGYEARKSRAQRNKARFSTISGLVGQIAYSKKLPAPTFINVVDFFCGCGGMSWGFANTRQSHVAFRVLAGIDLDDVALASYGRNIRAPTICEDIRKFAADPRALSERLGLGDLKKVRPLVFLGCPPCQGFSAHRKKDDRNDARNDLAVAFATLCGNFRPDAIVMENVPEMLKGRFENYFEMAARILKETGYNLATDVLDLSRYGVPQRRMRAVVLGVLGPAISMPEPPLPPDLALTVRDAIGHLPPLAAGECDPRDPFHRAPAHIGRIVGLIKQIPPDGGDRRALPQDVRLRCHTAVDSSRTPGFTDVYGRLRWDAPSVTITAKSSTPSCGRFLHPEQHRNISVREAAIIQGFPQGYVFEGPFANQYRQIGEAVPPLFSRFLAWQILGHFCPAQTGDRPEYGETRKASPDERKTTVGVIDAFCGAGGLSLGFQAAGFKSLYAFDNDPSAVQTFNGSVNAKAELADIADLRTAERISGNLISGQDFVVVGGPPCQGFSQQRRGEDSDDRNNLVLSYAKLIASLAIRPAAVVLENVTYLDSPRGQHILKQYLEQMTQLGYQIFRHDLNSAEFGVPQLRRRIVVVALQERFASGYSGPAPLCLDRWPTVGEALAGLPPAELDGESRIPNHDVSKEGQINKRRIMFVDMGGGRLSIPDALQLDCHRTYGGHLDVYGRLDWFSPARTITAGFDSFTRGEFAHPFFHRSITPREAARIQGFPDRVIFHGNRAAVRRQIGNAVPPPMAFALGKAIFSAITG